MRIVCISDTHNRTSNLEIPDGDVLIHAGDFCGSGNWYEIARFKSFLADLPHKHKIIIAGNHDWPLVDKSDPYTQALIKEFTYLEDSGCTIGGFNFWGSPWQPEFYNWAFNLPRGAAIREKWRLIPENTDVLITHGPPFGILDSVPGGLKVGCEDLATEVLQRVKPKVHVFGHIHHSYGHTIKDNTIFVNASTCTEQYEPFNPPIVIDL